MNFNIVELYTITIPSMKMIFLFYLSLFYLTTMYDYI